MTIFDPVDLGCGITVLRSSDSDTITVVDTNGVSVELADNFIHLDFKQARILRDWITENL